MTEGRFGLDSYKMEVFAEARRQGLLDEAERKRLLRAGAPAGERGPRWRARSAFAIVRRLARLARSPFAIVRRLARLAAAS